MIVPWSSVSPLASLWLSTTKTPSKAFSITSFNIFCAWGLFFRFSPLTTSLNWTISSFFILSLFAKSKSIFSCFLKVSSILSCGSSARDFLKYIAYTINTSFLFYNFVGVINMTKEEMIECIIRYLHRINDIQFIERIYKLTQRFYINKWFKWAFYCPFFKNTFCK